MLIERDAELQSMNHCLAEARRGKGQVILVSGEAGIGKSSLIQSMRQVVEAETPNTRWFEGGCEALFTPRTLGPVFDMAPNLGRVVELALATEGTRSTLYSAILSSLEKAQPAVMVCEDLHWADHATLDLLKFVARRINLLSVTLILSFRDDETTLTHPITHLLGDLPGSITTRLALKPLSEAGVNQLLASGNRSSHQIFSLTEGNPFYVSELLAADTGVDYLPASIKDAVALRTALLPAPAREVLERTSVLPKASTFAFLEALLGEELAQHLTLCLNKGLLIEDGLMIRFRHELTRLAIFDSLSPARRRQFHLDCLKLLETERFRGSLDEMVHHSAGAHDGDRVLRFAPKAAEAAATAGAHHEAAAHYQSALRFVNEAEPELAALLYESWAYESALADRMDDSVLDARRHAITLWRALGRQDKVGHNLRHLARLHWYRGESSDAARYADQAIQVLEALPASSERGMAYSMRSQLHMLNDQMNEAVEWGFRALDFESRHSDPDTRMHALNNIGTAMVFRNNKDGLIHLQESLRLALLHGHHENAARAYNNLAEYGVECRDFELAERILPEALAFDRQYNLDAWSNYLAGRQAHMRLDQGRLDEAIQMANDILDLKHPSLRSRLPANVVVSRARMRRGDVEAERLLLEALTNSLSTDEKQHIVPARISLIEWAWLTDSPGRAREHIERLKLLATVDRHPWNIGDRAIWLNCFGVPVDEFVDHTLPEPFRLELEKDFQRSAQVWRELGLPYEAAMVELRSGDPSLLEPAIQGFQSIGAELALRKARRLAEAAGIRVSYAERKRGPYQAARNHPLGLTAKEQEVLSCLKDGLSNREISDRLNRSHRTVEHHVSSILAKLNASNRTAAILRVQREPWIVK